MDYRTLDTMQRNHPAWQLLRADTAPLIASFLHHAFLEANTRTFAESPLVSLLDDYLFQLRGHP